MLEPKKLSHYEKTVAARMTEAQLQELITTTCTTLRLLWHHETDSRRTRAGFLDLVIVGKAVLFVELKTETGKLTPEQQNWVTQLGRAGAHAHVWRPTDWLNGQVIQTLRSIR